MSDAPIEAPRQIDRITYRCPACGNQTLIIDSIGHFVCSWLKCYDPCAFSDLIDAALSSSRSAPPAQIEHAFRAGYHSTWSPDFGWKFKAVYKPGDPDGAFAAYLATLAADGKDQP